MSTNQQAILETPPKVERHTLSFPRGLFGFESVKEYVLVNYPEESPFYWLEMAEDPDQSFLVVAPDLVVDAYVPEISREDAGFLRITGLHEAQVLIVVTPLDNGKGTANLKSPIVINPRTRVGKQIIPRNVSTFTSQYPLQFDEN